MTSAARIALAYSAIAAEPPAAKPLATCNNPDALGISRVVEIDTRRAGRVSGTEHFKQYDFLREKEVVLTYDDHVGSPPEQIRVVRSIGHETTGLDIIVIAENSRQALAERQSDNAGRLAAMSASETT